MNLTKRQSQIVSLLAQGHTAEQVAGEMHRSVGTIRRHVVLACGRVKAKNSVHLVGIAISRGWIAPLLLALTVSALSPDVHMQRPRSGGTRYSTSLTKLSRRHETSDIAGIAA